MRPYRLTYVDDQGYALEDDKGIRPLLRGGAFITKNYFDGYAITQLVRFGPFYLLEYKRNETDQYGIWLFDEDANYITDEPSLLDDDRRKQIDATITGHAATLWQALPAAFSGEGLQWSFDFGRLSLQIRSKLLWSSCRVRQTYVDVVDFGAGPLPEQIGEGESSLRLRLASINTVLSCAAPAFQDGIVADCAVTIPSPVSEERLSTRSCIVLTDFHFAYPFLDGDTLFFLLCWDHLFLPIGIYFPAQNVVIARKYNSAQHHVRYIGDEMVNHFAVYRDEVARYFGDGGNRHLAVSTRDMHLGHHLWNELTGFDRLISNAHLQNVEKVLVYAAEHSEMYGPIDTFFPVFKDRIVRFTNDNPAFIRFVYRENILPVRVSDHYISQRLADTIIKQGREPAFTLKPDAEIFCVVIGLRVESRAWANQIDGIIAAIEYLLTRVSRLRVILDGYNGLRSHGLTGRAAEARRQEHRIDRVVRGYFAGDARVVFENGLGLKLVDAIAQIAKADLFIAPWGAGLAKYRWICNLPGVIFTGKALTADSEITNKIYERTVFRENAFECIYVDPKYVVDLPEYPLLIDYFEPRLQNFYVEERGLIEAIAAALEPKDRQGRETPDRPAPSPELSEDVD